MPFRSVAVSPALALALILAVAAAGCSSGGEPAQTSGPELIVSETVTPGQAIWVAIMASGPDSAGLQRDLEQVRTAVGDYLADRVVVKEASCYEGVPGEFDGEFVVAIQDSAEHGVHAMYEAVTRDPPFYGPVTLAC